VESTVSKQVEISYISVVDEKERQKKLSEILTEGFYSYLKEKGLLKKDLKKELKIKELLEKAKGKDTPIDNEEIQESFKNN